MKQVRSPADVPQGTHFAVLIYKVRQIDIPGDERSRQAPGHGYPAHTEEIPSTEHWVTTDKDALAKFVYKQQQAKEQIVFFEVTRLGSLQVKVDISLK